MARALVDAALYYASRGWAVVPLHNIEAGGACSCKDKASCEWPGKHPRIHAGRDYDAASIEPDTIREWWRRWPGANVGIATGPSRLAVIDVDSAEGAVALRALGADPDELGAPCFRTGRACGNGRHYLFTMLEGDAVPSRDALLPRVDLKATGGMIVAPPSKHASGRAYRVERLSDETPPTLPKVILELARKTRPRKAEAATIPKGKRNAALTSYAGTLRANGADRAAIRDGIADVNETRCAEPLTVDELDKIAESVASYAPGNGGDGGWLLSYRSIRELVPERLSARDYGLFELLAGRALYSDRQGSLPMGAIPGTLTQWARDFGVTRRIMEDAISTLAALGLLKSYLLSASGERVLRLEDAERYLKTPDNPALVASMWTAIEAKAAALAARKGDGSNRPQPRIKPRLERKRAKRKGTRNEIRGRV